MFFQGAGASRPIADNSDVQQRGKNRRVEIVEVTDRNMLVKRVNAEQNNSKYLAHGTSTEPARTVARAPKNKPAATTKPAAESKPADAGTALVDFGGQPASDTRWTLAQGIAPKKAGFALVSSAQANDLPNSSCEADRPRETGKVFNLASGKALDTQVTTEYLPGYSNRVWANVVNGHLVTLSPDSILVTAPASTANPSSKWSRATRTATASRSKAKPWPTPTKVRTWCSIAFSSKTPRHRCRVSTWCSARKTPKPRTVRCSTRAAVKLSLPVSCRFARKTQGHTPWKTSALMRLTALLWANKLITGLVISTLLAAILIQAYWEKVGYFVMRVWHGVPVIGKVARLSKQSLMLDAYGWPKSESEAVRRVLLAL